MRLLPILLPLVLAACTSERQQCIDSATQELKAVNSAISVARGNIARGYAIARVRDVRQETYPCIRTRRDGTEVDSICTRQRPYTREEPVAVAVSEERVKLEALVLRQATLQSIAERQVTLCRQTYPGS